MFSTNREVLFISTQELEERLEETREKESATKDENSNLYQQLQEVTCHGFSIERTFVLSFMA